MNIYQTKSAKLAGTNYKEVYGKAFGVFQRIRQKTKRRPYIRSAYFKKEKIFLGLFWQHLEDHFNQNDKARRLKLYECGIELIQRSRYEPTSKENPNKPSEILHRFMGITKNKEMFKVQIKEDKRSGEKFLISIFPE